jgi:hypothetical protein
MDRRIDVLTNRLGLSQTRLAMARYLPDLALFDVVGASVVILLVGIRRVKIKTPNLGNCAWSGGCSP